MVIYMPSDSDYTFEMFDLRENLLAAVAKQVREGEPRLAEQDGKRMILRNATKNNSQNAKAFQTAFENAQELITDGGDTELKVEEAPALLRDDDHDGVIEGHQIDGRVVELIRSIDRSGWGESEETVYPVVAHDSGHRVCTCPSQKYHIVCKHTLARVIERNEPAPVSQK